MKSLRSFLLVLLHFVCVISLSQETQYHDSLYQKKMKWFGEAKLGIFIHWGVYAVNGIDESWSFYNGYISHENYLKQLDGFTAEKYNPEYWADLISESGARYVVITAKHHDGVALWDTKYGDLNTVKNAAAKSDLLTPFVKAVENEELKLGIYYSLPDWSFGDYTHFTRKKKRYENNPERWQKFLNYYQGQLNELTDKYSPDLYWFDGDWEHSAEEWEAEKVKKRIELNNPKSIINSRLKGYGDYETPEQGAPVVKPGSEYWELCMTMNDSWGYQPNDQNYKSIGQIIEIFTDVIGKGGNLLLDIGPKADGSIPEEQESILKELGKWTKKHKEAIYGTCAGIPPEHFYGPTTISKDKNILYLFVKGNSGGQIALRGIKNEINRIWVVGEGTKLQYKVFGKVFWNDYPGIAYIDLPSHVLDKNMTVIAVMLNGPVNLYRENISVIESN